MANVSYQTPLVVSDLYLPIPENLLSLEEYKNTYGIDLRPFVRLVADRIEFDFGLHRVWIIGSSGNPLGLRVLKVDNVDPADKYISGTQNALTHLLSTANAYGGVGVGLCLDFVIDKADDFDINSIKCQYNEI